MAIEDTSTQGQGASDTAFCSRCGMEQAEWSVSQGVQNARELYCCGGCAEGGDCVCAEAKQPAEQIGAMESEGGGSRETEQPHGRSEGDTSPPPA